MEYVFEKYVTTKENLRETLVEYGVAIIPSVLNEDECDKMVSGQWDFFEHITKDWAIPIDRNNEDSWRGFYKLYPTHSMLVQHWGVGQSQVVWDIRQKPKIVEIFANFWGCTIEELLVSFDAMSFHFPPEKTKRGMYRGNTWYHSDQSFKRNDLECVQSWVTGLDVEDNDATLTVYEGSHKFHKEFGETFPDSQVTNDWYKLSRVEEEFYKEKGCTRKYIKCPKGSLVFWDSRTIHCGVESNKLRENPKMRSVIYLCYKPRSFATEARLRKKRKAFDELRSTSHWPCKVKLFPKKPRTYGGPLPELTEIEKPMLTELGKKLAGF